MDDVIFSSNSQNSSIINLGREKDWLVSREVLCNASMLMQELFTQDKYFEELSGFIGQEDDDGNIPEIFEYWIVTPWFFEKLQAQGELVVEFFDLLIWGRQTTGQLISVDGVIEDIVKDLFLGE
jgi:hypothetical protein